MVETLETSSKKDAADEARGGLRIAGPARYAVAAVLALVIALNIFLLARSLGPPTSPPTSARLRATGGPVPLYGGSGGGEPLHWLKPGDSVHLGDVRRLRGPRYPAHVEIDGQGIEAVVDASDLEAGELERVKAAFERAGR